jgi:O-antigen/teichoic acid export membrane protein
MYPTAVSLLMVALSVTLMSKADLVLLSFWMRWGGVSESAALTGFAASTRLVDAVMLSLAPLSNVVIAYMSTTLSMHGVRPAVIVLRGAFVFWLGGWLVWGGGATAAEFVFTFVFGTEFQRSASWLKWASLSLPWMMANLFLLPAAIAVDLPRAVARDVVLCAIVFLVACAVLLSFFGPAGIGVGTACAHALLTLLLVRRLRSYVTAGGVINS